MLMIAAIPRMDTSPLWSSEEYVSSVSWPIGSVIGLQIELYVGKDLWSSKEICPNRSVLYSCASWLNRNISVCQIRSLSSEQILTSYNFFGIDNMTNSLNQHRFCQHLIQLIKFDSRYYTIIINTILLQPNLVSTALDQVFTFQLNNQLHNLIQEDEQLKETLEIYNRSNSISPLLSLSIP